MRELVKEMVENCRQYIYLYISIHILVYIYHGFAYATYSLFNLRKILTGEFVAHLCFGLTAGYFVLLNGFNVVQHGFEMSEVVMVGDFFQQRWVLFRKLGVFVEQLVHAMGGHLALENGVQGGLKARLLFPLEQR